MLPPTSAGNPEAVIISPVSVVVVVFPFDPVMATIGPGKKLRRQFDLANDAFAQRSSLHQWRSIHRNARADHNQILSLEGAVAMSPGLDGDAVIQQHGDFVTQLVAALGIRNRYTRAVRLHKQSRRHPGFSEPHHQHAFAVKFHAKYDLTRESAIRSLILIRANP